MDPGEPQGKSNVQLIQQLQSACAGRGKDPQGQWHELQQSGRRDRRQRGGQRPSFNGQVQPFAMASGLPG